MKDDVDNLKCKDCKHFVPERDVDGPGIPWCGNSKTKRLDHPICFLKEDAKACNFFEAVKTDKPKTISIGAINSRQDSSARKEHWSSTLASALIKVCLCIGFLKFAFMGKEEMTSKLALLLVIVSAAKEVSANFINKLFR